MVFKVLVDEVQLCILGKLNIPIRRSSVCFATDMMCDGWRMDLVHHVESTLGCWDVNDQDNAVSTASLVVEYMFKVICSG